jgi:hypothetical protein
MHKEYKWLERGTLGFSLQQISNFVCILIHNNALCSVIKLSQHLDISSFLLAFYVFMCGSYCIYLNKMNLFPYIGIWKMVGYLTVVKEAKHVYVTKNINISVQLALLSIAQWGHNLFFMFVYVVGFISRVKHCASFVLYMTICFLVRNECRNLIMCFKL